ncbi:hypothetical protein [Streptomyces sp. V1I6]|uniref:caspase, EACC1-associated type n=1 Tax=Streptomyces sp. V1I6 TaxID=3042273 RepID=UPI00277D8D98|nr:hypothetical protein [Streptomyces sp. V1I6]MDQ0846936.1 WD40 repeat protein [Streptomyces sp. V1I6]
MTDGLAASGARAVLVGTGTHDPASQLTDLPSVDRTLDDLQLALHEVCGMASEQVTRVPADAGPAALVAAVEEAAERTQGPLLLCYVGHGLLGPGDDLYLATRSSRSAHSVAGAVPFRTLRDLLGQRAQGSLVVLDCCFSGVSDAPGTDGGARGPFVSALPKGSFLLTSASHYALSFAPEGERHTLFGGRLLHLLTKGDPAGPLWLTADRLHTALEREFADDPRVRPARQSKGTLGGLVIARNRAYPAPDGAGPVEPPADVPCPYPGLAPFRTEESGHFFGRDELVERLAEYVVRPAGAEDPVVVVGASGAGKSSLLRAGLLAELERRHVCGDDTAPWPALLLPAPGHRPMRVLAEAWADATGRPVRKVLTALEERRFLPPRNGRLACRLLVVDQFEEVFTHCRDVGERAAFVAALAAGGGARPRVVLGLRADHYGSCLTYPELEHALAEAQVTVPPMGEQSLRAAVKKPADAVGLSLEPGLTERLLQDLREGRFGDDETGALPFLAHALRETWLRRSGARLTLAGYQATGGIGKSVAALGKDLYESLNEDDRAVLRDLLLRMVHLPPDGTGARAGIRHRVPLDSLVDGLPPAAVAIRDRLAEARLITVDQDTAQIAHEALLRAWPQLHDWIEQDAAALLLRQQVRTAADEWHAAGRDPAFLFRGSRLEAVLGLRKPGGNGPSLSEREAQFLTAGEEASASTRRHEQRRMRVLKAAVVALVVGLLVAVGSAVVALQQEQKAQEQRATAQEQRELATYRALLAEAQNLRVSYPRASLDLGLAAHALRPTGESRRVLADTLAASPFRSSMALALDVDNTVLGADGRTLAAPEGSDGLTLWDVGRGSTRRTPLARLKCRASDSAHISFGGRESRTLAAVCGNTVSLWDLTGLHTGAAPRLLSTARVDSLPGEPEAVGLSSDGRRLAAVGWWSEDESVAAREGGALALWDVSDPAKPRRVSLTKGVYETDRVVFGGPQGRALATGARYVRTVGDVDLGNAYAVISVRFWDVSDPRRPRTSTYTSDSDGRAAFSPDGRSLVTVDQSSVQLIDVTDPMAPKKKARWTVHAGEVQSLAFSPDGRRLATGGDDGIVAVWDLSDGTPERLDRLAGHVEITGSTMSDVDIGTIGFGPDGRTLVSVDTYGGDDSEFIHWNLGGTQQARVVGKVESDGSLGGMALTPDRRTLATGAGAEVLLWDLTDRTRPRRQAALKGPYSLVADVALNADGTLLASAHVNGAVVLWNVADPVRPRVVGRIATEPSVSKDLTFAPREPLLAIHGDDLGLWSVADPSRPARTARVPEVSSVTPVSFSPNGRHLVTSTGGVGHGTSLWDLTAGDDVFVEFERTEGFPLSLQGSTGYSPDGTTVAIARSNGFGDDDALFLFDVGDPRAPRLVSSVPSEDEKRVSFSPLAFHPEGNLVVAGGDDGSARLWSTGDREEPHLATTLGVHPAQVTDVAFGPGKRTLLTRSDDTVNVWDLGDWPEIAANTVGMACRVAGGGLEDWEWQVHAPEIPYRESCPSD